MQLSSCKKSNKAAKVGHTGNRGRRAWNVEGSRSRHVD
ncbi:hypothetical protein FOXG_22875, partial [Fusarium oxysporum f. sp. lycopersici 4287]